MMVCGNVFMTTAWYWHLKRGAADGKPLLLIVLMSWGIALLEYLIMVPANRLGVAAGLSVAQLISTMRKSGLPSAAPRFRCQYHAVVMKTLPQTIMQRGRRAFTAGRSG